MLEKIFTWPLVIPLRWGVFKGERGLSTNKSPPPEYVSASPTMPASLKIIITKLLAREDYRFCFALLLLHIFLLFYNIVYWYSQDKIRCRIQNINFRSWYLRNSRLGIKLHSLMQPSINWLSYYYGFIRI